MEELWESAFGPRTEERPNRKGRHREFLRPKAGEQIKAVCTSTKLLVAWTHWTPDGSVLCVGIGKRCAHCVNKSAPAARMRGFLCGLSMKDGKEVVIELTEEAIKTNSLLASADHDLKGCVILLRRNGKNDRSPVSAAVSRSEHIPNWMPRSRPPFDLKEQLVRTFNPPLIILEEKEVVRASDDDWQLEMFEEVNEDGGSV